jgi:hypothetical protein
MVHIEELAEVSPEPQETPKSTHSEEWVEVDHEDATTPRSVVNDDQQGEPEQDHNLDPAEIEVCVRLTYLKSTLTHHVFMKNVPLALFSHPRTQHVPTATDDTIPLFTQPFLWCPPPPPPAAQARLKLAEEHKAEGNKLFTQGEYDNALDRYSTALETAPITDATAKQRAVYYANRAACHARRGSHASVVQDCSAALDLEPKYVKALLRRSAAYEGMEEWERAEADAKQALEFDPGNLLATETLGRVGPKAEARREEMKEEMIGKLKELGNTVLGKFGLSLDNFKAEKDPNSGGYSIKFG